MDEASTSDRMLRALTSSVPEGREAGRFGTISGLEESSVNAEICGTGDRQAQRQQLDATLRERTSVRDLRGTSAQIGDVAALLRTAQDRSERMWRGWTHTDGRRLVRIAALCWRVSDLAPGVYLWESGQLTATGRLEREWAADFAVQQEFCDAPLWLVCLGDLMAAQQRHQDSSYRVLLLQAGSMLHHAWLYAVRLNMHGAMFAGLRATALGAALGVSDAEQRGLAGLALGRQGPA